MPDVVVIGSGHNGLVAAAYLARAGLEVEVLKRNAEAGGAVATEELTMPGHQHDTFSSFHSVFQLSDTWAELGDELLARGLAYCESGGATTAAVLPDGRAVVAHRDVERTVEAFDPADRDTYVGEVAAMGRATGRLGRILGTELHSVPATRLAAGFGRSLGLRRGLGFAADLLAPATGWLGSRFRNGQVADTITTSMNAVLAHRSDAVIVAAINIELWKNQLAQLQAAEVPVVTVGVSQTQGYGVPGPTGGRAVHHLSRQAVRELRHRRVEHRLRGGELPDPGTEPHRGLGGRGRGEARPSAPGLHARTVEIAITTVGNTAPSTIVRGLQAHPETTVVVLPNDEVASGLPAALSAAGIECRSSAAHPALSSCRRSGMGGRPSDSGSTCPSQHGRCSTRRPASWRARSCPPTPSREFRFSIFSRDRTSPSTRRRAGPAPGLQGAVLGDLGPALLTAATAGGSRS